MTWLEDRVGNTWDSWYCTLSCGHGVLLVETMTVDEAASYHGEFHCLNCRSRRGDGSFAVPVRPTVCARPAARLWERRR